MLVSKFDMAVRVLFADYTAVVVESGDRRLCTQISEAIACQAKSKRSTRVKAVYAHEVLLLQNAGCVTHDA